MKDNDDGGGSFVFPMNSIDFAATLENHDAPVGRGDSFADSPTVGRNGRPGEAISGCRFSIAKRLSRSCMNRCFCFGVRCKWGD